MRLPYVFLLVSKPKALVKASGFDEKTLSLLEHLFH